MDENLAVRVYAELYALRPYCSREWDGVMCWPQTAANQTTRLPCPTKHPGRFAYKRCEEDGKWFALSDNVSWANYSMCADADNESVYGKIYKSLQIVYSIGYSLSLISLVIATGIFLYFRKLRCTRNVIHMHLFMSFILRAIFVFIRDIIDIEEQNDPALYNANTANSTNSAELDRGNPGCQIAFTLIQYFLVANFYWLLVEGVYLHSLITLAVFTEKSIYRYIALGWGCPVLVVVPWAIYRGRQKSPGCFVHDATEDSSYWIIKAPVMISIFVNFVLFLRILCVLATKLRASNAAEARTYSKLAKSTLILIPLFGVYYIVTAGLHASNDKTMIHIRVYFELVISSFQGFLLAILYCFMNGEVKNEIKRKWRLHLLNRTLSTHRTLRNGQSRSSCSTPPRKDSMKKDSVLETSLATRSTTLGDRFYALRKQFSRGDSSNGHVGNGSLGNSMVLPDPYEPRPTPDGAADKNSLYDDHPPNFDENEQDEEANETTKIDIKIEEPSDVTPDLDAEDRLPVVDGTEDKSDVFEDEVEDEMDDCERGNVASDDDGANENEKRQTLSNIETEV
ncbi:vasoactive intestinal polypeptide receptor 1-like [Diadema antillarum]|uniref:vasoactive intestinal polypeptide receptor 1-like n=1 Tax=Diadema antillarum TaxID=105358 RepID=UPI003A872EFF